MKFLLFFVALIMLNVTSFSQTRPHYGGGHHTSSHGGTYQGGSSGSSHKGGHYVNPCTGNQYGTHKTPATVPSTNPTNKPRKNNSYYII